MINVKTVKKNNLINKMEKNCNKKIESVLI